MYIVQHVWQLRWLLYFPLSSKTFSVIRLSFMPDCHRVRIFHSPEATRLESAESFWSFFGGASKVHRLFYQKNYLQMGSSCGSSVIPLQRRVRLAFSTPIEAATASCRDSAVISSGKEDTKISAPTMLCPITLGKSKPQLSGFTNEAYHSETLL